MDSRFSITEEAHPLRGRWVLRWQGRFVQSGHTRDCVERLTRNRAICQQLLMG